MSEIATPPAAPVLSANNPAHSPTTVIQRNPSAASESSRAERIKAAMAEAPTPPADAPKAPDATPPKNEAPAAPAAPKAPTVFEKKADAPAAPTPEADPVDGMKLAANAAPESVARFADLAKVAKERKASVDMLTKRIAELEAAPKTASAAAPAEAAEIDRLRQEHKLATDRLAIMDLQNHPDFTRQFVEPKKKALALASEVLSYNGKEGVELAPLLAKPLKEFNAAVSEFTKDMNTADAATVSQSLRDARSLHTQEQAQLSNSGEIRTQLQAKAALEQKRAFEEVAGGILPNFAKMEITEGMDATAKESALNYNKSVDTLRQRAEAKAFGKVSEKDVARMAFADVALDHMVHHAVPALEAHSAKQSELIASLTAELEGLRGKKSPNVSSGATPPGAVKTTREQRVAAAFAQA